MKMLYEINLWKQLPTQIFSEYLNLRHSQDGIFIVRIEFSPVQPSSDNNGHYGALETTHMGQLNVTLKISLSFISFELISSLYLKERGFL